MTQIDGGHVDDGVGAVPGPDSVNRRRVSGPGTEPGSVPGLTRLKWAICKRGYRRGRGQTTARVTSLAAGSIADAAMIIFTKKSKIMHTHKTTRTSATTEAGVAKLNLSHKCELCAREFTKLRGLKIHMASRCDGGGGGGGGRRQRSRVGFLTDKRRAAEASLDKVTIGSDTPLENVPHFQDSQND